MAQQHVVCCVAVEGGGPRDGPAVRRKEIGRGMIAKEGSTGLAEPFGHGTIVVEQQYVVLPVTVKIPDSRHIPASGKRVSSDHVVAKETAVGLTEPFGYGAIVMRQEQVVATVAVEVSCSCHIPSDIYAVVSLLLGN